MMLFWIQLDITTKIYQDKKWSCWLQSESEHKVASRQLNSWHCTYVWTILKCDLCFWSFPDFRILCLIKWLFMTYHGYWFQQFMYVLTAYYSCFKNTLFQIPKKFNLCPDGHYIGRQDKPRAGQSLKAYSTSRFREVFK